MKDKSAELNTYRDAVHKFEQVASYQNAWEVLRAAYDTRHEHLMLSDRNIIRDAAQIAINERNYTPCCQYYKCTGHSK